MVRTLLTVGIGGAFGSMARFGLSALINRYWVQPLPLATLLINLLGALAIGMLYGWTQRSDWMSATGWPLLATGVCGGFTTFSAFAYENVKLLQLGHSGTALAYIGASLAGGLLCCWCGYLLAR